MIIIAGTLTVAAAERDAFLAQRVGVMEHARSVPGCLDFTLSADPLDAERVNVYERWETDEDLRRFRSGEAGAGPEPAASPAPRAAAVALYRIAAVEAP